MTAVLALCNFGAPTLATAGSGDGLIKLWDLRMPTEPSASMALQPVLSAPCVAARGITCLAQDPTGTLLAASVRCNDRTAPCLAIFNAFRPEGGPTLTLGGHLVESFFVRADFSRDGRRIASGSSDGAVYVWDMDRPQVSGREDGDHVPRGWTAGPPLHKRVASANAARCPGLSRCRTRRWCLRGTRESPRGCPGGATSAMSWHRAPTTGRCACGVWIGGTGRWRDDRRSLPGEAQSRS